jgi:HK97 family phage portal protein
VSLVGNVISRPERRSMETQWQDIVRKIKAGHESYSGIDVSLEAALTFSTVFACVSLVSESVGCLPWGAYARYGPARYDRQKPSWMVKPNPRLTFQDMVSGAVASLATIGDWYALPVRDDVGNVAELYPVDARSVSVRGTTDAPQYRIKGQIVEDIVHVPAFKFPGNICGLSPIDLAKQGIGNGLAAEKYAGKFYSNASLPTGIIKGEAGTTEEEAREIVEIFMATTSGADNAGKPGFLAGAEWQSLTLTHEQAQFLQSRQFQREELASWWHCPPNLVGISEKSNSWPTAVEQQAQLFVRHGLLPYITRLETCFSGFVAYANPGWYVKANINAMLRGDIRAQIAYYQAGQQGGWLNANAICELEDRNPVPGGDVYYITSNNLSPVGSDGLPVSAPSEVTPNV